MSMKDEKAVKNYLDKKLKAYAPNIASFKPAASVYGKRGVHDFILCIRGLFVTVETKSPMRGKSGISPLQNAFAGKITAAGGVCFIVWDMESADLFLEWVDFILSKTKRDSTTTFSDYHKSLKPSASLLYESIQI